MAFTWSDQQLSIFEELANPTSDVVLIKAVAGATKSSSLVEGTKRYKAIEPAAKVQYVIFGNTPAAEARAEFGQLAQVSTLHALAHHYTVQPYGLGTVKPFVTWRDIPKSIRRPFGIDYDLTQQVEAYCSSGYTNLQDYLQEQYEINDNWDYRLDKPIKDVLNAMSRGDMPVTHSFYLKLFHIMVMKGKIKLPPVDRLLVDEAQDLNRITLDVINNIPAKQKVLVGDSSQRIFYFLNLIDGFKEFTGAKELALTKSFRVDQKYAPAIQKFLRKYLDESALFDGMKYPENPTIKTKAYLTRNNNSLIAKMIGLNEAGIPYHLASKAKVKQMFALPLFLIYAAPGRVEKNSDLKHFQQDMDKYGMLPVSVRASTTKYAYLLQVNNNEPKLKSAIAMIAKFGSDAIIEASKQAVIHQKTPCDLSLMTVFMSKGATFDKVTLDGDLLEIYKKYGQKRINTLNEEERAEMAVLLVAVTRHRHELLNATFLGAVI